MGSDAKSTPVAFMATAKVSKRTLIAVEPTEDGALMALAQRLAAVGIVSADMEVQPLGEEDFR